MLERKAMKIRRSLLAIACFLMVGITPNYAQPATGKDVSLMAADGIQLQATYFPAAKSGPGIMLLHQCDGGRKEWANLASMLSAHGFHVLTLDYRGFGDSGDKRYSDLDPEARRAVQAKWTGDIEVALNYLLAQSAVDKNRIGVGGASCGANNSVALAIRHPEVNTLVLLSGGTNVAGLNFIHEADWLPIFAAASDDDGGFVPYLRWILSFSKNPQTNFVEYKKAGHGTDMFAVEKGLEPAIVDWFGKTPRFHARARKRTCFSASKSGIRFLVFSYITDWRRPRARPVSDGEGTQPRRSIVPDVRGGDAWARASAKRRSMGGNSAFQAECCCLPAFSDYLLQSGQRLFRGRQSRTGRPIL
jgi:dienelactone hydrolase